jgi:AraC family transcriptional regulator, regulatory protein of adaptative response / methylated-DNA-[protein]-cysteine methyltransferase
MSIAVLENGVDRAAALAAFDARDKAQDGRFVGAVLTTGIYCRPSCPARRPKPENVRFYPTNAEARTAGFRACLRCRPDDLARDETAIAQALTLLDAAEENVSLEELAAQTGYSATHLQRLFTRAIGLSPAAYARAKRRERAANALSEETKVTDAIYAAGYSGPSRFYDDAGARLGMAPSAWRNGGRGVTIHWAVVPTSLGAMLVAATDKGVCRLSFNEGVDALATRFPHAELVEGGEAFSTLLADVIAAVEAPGLRADHIPLDVQGTAFQEAVWTALRAIPAGETRSYAQLAASVGRPKAVRAAGSANGANNVSVLIPCHRVIRTDGSLGGYAYGLEIKRKLLEKEGVG